MTLDPSATASRPADDWLAFTDDRPMPACPIARAEAGLAAIFAACEANKARQAAEAARLEKGRFWWRKEG